jgi:LacI family transcriptional regulator
VRTGSYDADESRAAAAELLSLPDPPTALFAANDLSAIAVMEEAATRGLRVPEDLSVVGFDDVRRAPWSSPP